MSLLLCMIHYTVAACKSSKNDVLKAIHEVSEDLTMRRTVCLTGGGKGGSASSKNNITKY